MKSVATIIYGDMRWRSAEIAKQELSCFAGKLTWEGTYARNVRRSLLFLAGEEGIKRLGALWKMDVSTQRESIKTLEVRFK